MSYLPVSTNRRNEKESLLTKERDVDTLTSKNPLQDTTWSTDSSSVSSAVSTDSELGAEGAMSNRNPHRAGSSSSSSSSIMTVIQQLSEPQLDPLPGLQQALPTVPSLVKTGSSSSLSSISSDPHNHEDKEADDSTTPLKRKSSLKLPSLIRSRSLPSPSKTVRFSTDLTKIKTFDNRAKPSSISLENSPDSSEISSPTHSPRSTPKAVFDLDSIDFAKPSWYNNSSSSDDDDYDLDDDFDQFSSHYRTQRGGKNKWALKTINFSLYKAKYSNDEVRLTSISIKDDTLVGYVQVENLAFEKYVEIKFTIDDWQTIYIVNAFYDSSLSSRRDQFKFETNLKKSLIVDSQKRASPSVVELCIRYVVSNGEGVFYDNNKSQNYKFEIVQNKPSQQYDDILRKSNSYNHGKYKFPNYSNSVSGNFTTATSLSEDGHKNYTTSRYFSDETDYFNTNYKPFKNLEQKEHVDQNISSLPSNSSIPSQKFGSTSSSSSSLSISSSISSNTSSSNETITPYTLKSDSKKWSTESEEAVEKSTTKGDGKKSNDLKSSNYNDFLKKYCFFKSDDPNGCFDVNESVFIR